MHYSSVTIIHVNISWIIVTLDCMVCKHLLRLKIVLALKIKPRRKFILPIYIRSTGNRTMRSSIQISNTIPFPDFFFSAPHTRLLTLRTLRRTGFQCHSISIYLLTSASRARLSMPPIYIYCWPNHVKAAGRGWISRKSTGSPSRAYTHTHSGSKISRVRILTVYMKVHSCEFERRTSAHTSGERKREREWTVWGVVSLRLPVTGSVCACTIYTRRRDFVICTFRGIGLRASLRLH